MKNNEIWADVLGYEGLYKVSSYGRVKGMKSNKELKYSYTYNGYQRVKLYKDAKGKTFMVHRLVATAFLKNSENKIQVNHKNGVKTNNTVENLEWATQTENLRHAYRCGLIDISKMTDATKKKVCQFDKKMNLIKEWDSISEAARRLKLQISNISHCCSGRIKSTGGYIWRLSSEICEQMK